MKRWLLLLLLFVAASAAQKFVDMLADSGDFIKAGKYAEALKLDDVVIAQMGEHYVSGDATAQLFAIAVAHKALALAGLGKEDDALWYWYAAASIYPAVARSDMSAFGAAGKFLAEHPPNAVDVRVPKDAQIVPPKTLKQVQPQWPSASLTAWVSTPIMIECIIGVDGRVHTPRLVGDVPAPILAYAAMEALRQWQFTPGSLDGKPIEIPLQMTFNFKVHH
jgi:hypothetical protein